MTTKINPTDAEIETLCAMGQGNEVVIDGVTVVAIHCTEEEAKTSAVCRECPFDQGREHCVSWDLIDHCIEADIVFRVKGEE